MVLHFTKTHTGKCSTHHIALLRGAANCITVIFLMILTTKFASSFKLEVEKNLSSSPGTVNTLNPVSGQELGQSLVCSLSQRFLKLKPCVNDSILNCLKSLNFMQSLIIYLKVNETDHKDQPSTVSVAFVFETCKVTSSITGL